jgi:hypothetical protein
MAAIVPDSITEESMGSLKLLICNFETTLIDTADTWASGLGSTIVGNPWSSCSSDEVGAVVNVANVAGALTFHTNAGDNNAAVIYILVRG